MEKEGQWASERKKREEEEKQERLQIQLSPPTVSVPARSRGKGGVWGAWRGAWECERCAGCQEVRRGKRLESRSAAHPRQGEPGSPELPFPSQGAAEGDESAWDPRQESRAQRGATDGKTGSVTLAGQGPQNK